MRTAITGGQMMKRTKKAVYVRCRSLVCTIGRNVGGCDGIRVLS